MTTNRQIEANRENAKHSTGPRTDEGKQRCSQNAFKHGLRSKHPVIPGEDPAEYQHKLEKLRNDIRPLNDLEDDLVEKIADTSWRLKRLSRIEAAVERFHFEEHRHKEQNAGKDDEQILGDAFTDYGSLDYLTRLGRYEVQLSRRYHCAVKELTNLRKNGGQTLFRQRPMEERDREEQEWQKQHSQPPPEQPRPAAAASANGASSANADHGDSIETAGQTQFSATDLDSVPWDEFEKLPPAEAVERIDNFLNGRHANTGHPGPKEAGK